MGISKKVVLRDCLALAVILLCVASAAAQAQVLATYQVCAVSAHETCAEPRDRCASPTRSERDGFLQWAVAMHRAVASDARVAMRTVKPATVADYAPVGVAEVMKDIACSH